MSAVSPTKLQAYSKRTRKKAASESDQGKLDQVPTKQTGKFTYPGTSGRQKS